MTDRKFASYAAKEVSAMNGPELLALFNRCAEFVGAPIVKRFASLTTGYTRTVKMLAQAVEREAETTQAEEPALNPISVTKESVAAKVKANPKAAIEKAKAPKGAKVWEKTEDGSCPRCGGADSDITYAGEEGTAAAHRHLCHNCNLEWDPETGKEYKERKYDKAVRSAAVAKSWEDPAVQAKRAERHGVKVSGGKLNGVQEFPSVRKAFLALALPLSRHIKFRMTLKEHGELMFDDLKFVVFEKEVEAKEKNAKKSA